MTLSLCAHMSASAQINNSEGLVWQSLDDFLTQSESINKAQEPYDPQTLGPGDIITVTIKKVPDLSQEYTIDKNGEIDFPLIGRVRSQGTSPEALAVKLAVLYEKDYLVNPAVTVSIFAKRLPKVAPARRLTGAAKEPIDDESITQPEPSAIAYESAKLIEPRFETIPEAAPVVTPAPVLQVALPETLPEPLPEPLPAPVMQDTPPLIVQDDALPNPLANSHWSVEGSPLDFIHFLSGGDIAGALSCNSFFGRYEAGQNDISIRSLTTTILPCADQSKPQEFVDNLVEAKSYIYDQGNLLILDDQNIVIFALQPR